VSDIINEQRSVDSYASLVDAESCYVLVELLIVTNKIEVIDSTNISDCVQALSRGT